MYFSIKICIVSNKIRFKAIHHLQYRENVHFLLQPLILYLYTGCRLDQTLSKCITSFKKVKVLKCSRYECSSFPKPYYIPSTHAYEIHLKLRRLSLERWNWRLCLFLDAFPPRPKMPFGQRHVAINIYNICKGHFGSREGGAS